MNWKPIADWGKKRPAALRLVDRLDRSRGRLRWLDHWRPAAPAPLQPDLRDWEKHELAAVWIGHATVLLRLGGMNILTDPVFSDRVGISLGIMTGGPQRLRAAALTPRQLPRIDLILLSHAHFDHLDRPSLVRLPKQTPVIAAHHTVDLIRDLGFRRTSELRWGESARVGNLEVTAAKVNHWGARTFYDRHRGFNAYLLDAGGRRVLYGGDTAYHEGFKDLKTVDLAIMGIGAYDPYIAAHATPEQAWAMADHVRADYIMPMHHSTFRLSHEPVGEPMQRMLAAAGRDDARIVARDIGGQWAWN